MDASGYAEAARNHIAALDHVGVSVNVKPVSFEGYRSDLGRIGDLVQSLINRNAEGNIRILHVTPPNYPKTIDPNKYNIGYCAWETDRLPDQWLPLIGVLDEVWVPCEHNKQVFINSGIKIPIHVMPHPFDTEAEVEEVSETVVANISPEDYVFYSVFQWTERKNPIDLLKAYLTEFKREEPVVFVLKTYLLNPGNPQESKGIRQAIKDIKTKLYLPSYPKILLISTLLSRPQIRALNSEGDCYVSLHRCEGFGIPFAEAMLASNPVIATQYGGPADFMTTQPAVPYILTPVYGMPWGIYTGYMKWAQPDIMQARGLMRGLFTNREKGIEIGKAGRKEIEERLNYTVLGNRMKSRLEEIEKGLK
jgi:glycosyltransferase involved in cell wall biosynthesis